MKGKKMVLILVILLVIGFASISTTLLINGVIGISNNKDDFKVIFINAILDGEKRNDFIDEETQQIINYETRKLTMINETTKLEYEVANTSRLYDAEIELKCTTDNEEYISVEYNPTNMVVAAGEEKNGSITVKLIKSTPEDKNVNITLTLKAKAKERESLGNKYIKEEYKEAILNGTDPVLKDGLIPVVISKSGTVTRADTESEWYSYEKKNWANAVILEDETKKYYEGEVIPEDNIESYFVWVPRYKYKIWNVGNYSGTSSSVTNAVRTIEVVFENKEIPASKGTTVGSYLTHPAFTNFNVNGLWVGKFETGYKGAASTNAASINTYDVDKVQIKPNVYSWRSIQVANAHLNSYNYKREFDSHMMKNTEWGAVAYLQHSKYGSRQSVRINNNSAFITGYGAKNEPTAGAGVYSDFKSTALNENGSNTFMYNTDYGYLASTTANITGIYDMSGGAFEYVMGVMKYTDGSICVGRNSTRSSGFKGRYCESSSAGYATNGPELPPSKYYDVYPYGTKTNQYQGRVLGDAINELGPFSYSPENRLISSWYSDESSYITNAAPWFYRGGYYNHGNGCGMFTFFFGSQGGGIESVGGYRIVLAV